MVVHGGRPGNVFVEAEAKIEILKGVFGDSCKKFRFRGLIGGHR
jgi:hypothetical protein